MTSSFTELEKHIAQRLCLARKQKGVSSQAVAEAVGVLQQQYSRYERAVNRISVDMLYRLAKYFDRPLGWFFWGFEESGFPAVSDKSSNYTCLEGPEELAIVESNWRHLTVSQRKSIVNLVETMVVRD